MAAPRKHPEELWERAVRLAVDARRDPVTRPRAFTRIGTQLGINPETLRNWVQQVEIDRAIGPGSPARTRSGSLSSSEVRELRRANEILTTASAFFAAGELDRRLT